MSPSPTLPAVLAACALALPSIAAGQPADLFFSEYVEGAGNDKALEIHNATGASVDLTATGYAVEMYFNGSATPGLILPLSGTVADGDVFVLANAGASASILAQADQTSAASWFNGNDAVVLRRPGAVVDVIGQVGLDPGAEWGAGLASTADNTLRRRPDACAGDPNGADAFDPSAEWNGFATGVVDGLGAHSCGAIDSCAPLPTTPIPAIQGSGASAAIAGDVTTEGVVIGDYELPAGSGQLRGFYLQDVNGDGDPATSDGIFVFTGGGDAVSLGDVVRVTGTVAEFQAQTQITSAFLERCGTATVAPVDVVLPFPSADFPERFEGMLVRIPQTVYVTDHFQLGRFGQIVVSSGARLAQPTNVVPPGAPAAALQAANDRSRLIVDDADNTQNADPILLGRGGLPLSATNTLRGGDEAAGIVGVLTYGWAGNAASGNAWRLRPFGALGGSALFVAAHPRPAVPAAPPATGVLRVASLNLLNFFDSFGVAGCTLGVGGAITACRGAENAAELDRQAAKTVSAILGANADVVAAMELENDGYGPGTAIQLLVDRLNGVAGPGAWAYVDADAATGRTNALGTDAIKVALLYRPSRVSPVGQTAALDSAAFVNGGDASPRNRPSLAQAFEQAGTGERFVVSVNHWKSKGSPCDAPDAGDGQDECNAVRVQAANALAAWLATDPTGTGDPDVLVVGDLNSYAMEDPITVLGVAGYVDLVKTRVGPGAYSYAFDGQWGSLDHALASAGLASQVAAVAHWPINADEPNVLGYDTNFKSAGQLASLYAADPFRAADHDPLLVDLALGADDADGDGVPDASDNCPFAPNGPGEANAPGVGFQSDAGGVGAGSPSDGIGDACQCGDVNGDGRVTLADAVNVQRSLLTPPTAALDHPDRCDVGGGGAGCSLGDAVVLRRALLAPPAAAIAQQCAAALP